MSILTPEYIKEQAHKPCFWSEEYGFDVVAFTLAMEQVYSNRVGSKINELKKSATRLETENARLDEELAKVNLRFMESQKENARLNNEIVKLREELRKVSDAINDPECDLTKTMVECINKLKEELAAAQERIKNLVAGDVMHEPDWRSSNEV